MHAAKYNYIESEDQPFTKALYSAYRLQLPIDFKIEPIDDLIFDTLIANSPESTVKTGQISFAVRSKGLESELKLFSDMEGSGWTSHGDQSVMMLLPDDYY